MVCGRWAALLKRRNSPLWAAIDCGMVLQGRQELSFEQTGSLLAFVGRHAPSVRQLALWEVIHTRVRTRCVVPGRFKAVCCLALRYRSSPRHPRS